ncbi:hypothetical protein DH09_01175 (plasmid) [Bacillaceae bacterium JMAK1]|nr:hypothetical protein DH09_01175 [Bacillaceae bacterium JMAK1]
MDEKNLTNKIKNKLQSIISKPSYDLIASQIIFIKVTDTHWKIICPSEYIKEFVKQSYINLFKERDDLEEFHRSTQFDVILIENFLVERTH